jgi:hypothetical protein
MNNELISTLLKSVKTPIDLDNVINVCGLNYQDLIGESFLHELSRIGKIELITHMLSRDHKIRYKEHYNVNVKNNLGRTALFDALNEEIVEFLLLYRIDYKCKDLQGKTADQVNEYVNFIINQKCNETKKKIISRLLGINN